VLVLDVKGIGAGMSGIQPGGLRTQWSSAVTRRLAIQSRDFYADVAERLQVDVDPGFEACGYLFVASDPRTWAHLQVEAAEHRREGLDVRSLSREEVGESHPGLNEDVVLGASYGAEDGYLSRPGAPLAAFAEAATQLGVEFTQGEVQQVNPAGSGVSVSISGESPVSAGACVIAAGAESASLVGVGSRLPVRKEPKYLFYSDRIATRLIEPLVVFLDHHFAVKHLADGSVLASDLSLERDAAADAEVARRAIRRTATELIPILEHVRYPVMVEGVYDATPDGQLVVGAMDDAATVWVATGMNGRGMMLAPGVGRLVADGVRRRSDDLVPREFLPGRFDSGSTTGGGETRVI
jgi:sarcosine oxidase subunit beta